MRIHLFLAAAVALGALVSQALSTSRRSDEAALAVGCGWVAVALVRRARSGPLTGRPGPARGRARVTIGTVLLASVVLAAGLGLYAMTLGLETRPEARPAIGTTGPGSRPCVVVAPPDSPVLTARVVAVNPDFSLDVDDGTNTDALLDPTRAAETIFLAGLDPSRVRGETASAAVRHLKSELLGRLVTVKVVASSQSDLKTRSKTGLPARVLAYVFAGPVDSATCIEEESLNREVADLLAPATPAGPENPGTRAGAEERASPEAEREKP